MWDVSKFLENQEAPEDEVSASFTGHSVRHLI